MKIKVHGLPRSGNNWTMAMLDANFGVTVLHHNQGGNTHGKLDIDGKDAPEAAVLIVKHPLAWMPSIFRLMRPDIDFNTFVRRVQPWKRWAMRNRIWFEEGAALSIPFQVVLYEDLLTRTVGRLEEIGSAFGMEKISEEWLLMPRKMNKGMGQTIRKFDPTYYTEKKYLEEYESDILAEVNDTLDVELLTDLGYDG